jgi:hypothetical protein
MRDDGGGGGWSDTAAHMPARVQPVDGARVVHFPWEAARAAVAALNDARAALGTQLDNRVDMYNTLGDWRGVFRDDFNSAESRITAVAIGLRDAFGRKAAAIVSAAVDANDRQRDYNDLAGIDPRLRRIPV